MSIRIADTRIRWVILRAALAPLTHHATRDVHAEVSGRGVARVNDLVALLGLDVAEPVRHVTDARAPARALHTRERLGMLGREPVEHGDVRLRREHGRLAATHGLDLIAYLVDRHLRGARSEPPEHAGAQCEPDDDRRDRQGTLHADRLSSYSRPPRRSAPRPVRSSYSPKASSWNAAARLSRASKASPFTGQYGTSSAPIVSRAGSIGASVPSLSSPTSVSPRRSTRVTTHGTSSTVTGIRTRVWMK